MRIIRYVTENGKPQLAAVTDEDLVYDLPQTDFIRFVKDTRALHLSPTEWASNWIRVRPHIESSLSELTLTTPLDAPEVWACGVTYRRSLEARNYEATGGEASVLTCYDKVYDAERPELFFKSTAARTVGPEEPVFLRSDSRWQVPEPELGLVLDAEGSIVGYTIGNDMSCRDIEGENPLYLPQAKIWKHSCAIGPAIRLADSVPDPYAFTIHCRIVRDGETVFEEEASVGQLKRKLEELASWLCRDNVVFDGTVLLTGTCIVPPNEFSLLPGDRIDIAIPGIGVLSNPVSGA